MQRLEIFEPDESALKEMMQGELPRAKHDDKPHEDTSASASAPADKETGHVQLMPEEPKGVPVKPPGRGRRVNATDYESAFLVNTPTSIRAQVSIGRELNETMKYYLKIIAPRLSVTGFLNNIISHHLESYRDQINELYDKKLKGHL